MEAPRQAPMEASRHASLQARAGVQDISLPADADGGHQGRHPRQQGDPSRVRPQRGHPQGRGRVPQRSARQDAENRRGARAGRVLQWLGWGSARQGCQGGWRDHDDGGSEEVSGQVAAAAVGERDGASSGDHAPAVGRWCRDDACS
uniref:Gamma-glutamyltranspeptidase 1 n=1 Tax=Arundo donax TaxID=35708 RepID=A0A0A9G5Y6_ARUDO